MWKSLSTNWTTSVPGLLAGICGATELFELLPDAWRVKAMSVCAILVAIGLIAAKSANVSNAPKPVEAAVVSAASAATPNPSTTPPPVS